MGTNRLHYIQLKLYMSGHYTEHLSGNLVHLIMECAVLANIAIDSVNRAEMELTMEHPHLTSFYHVLAVVFFTNLLQKSMIASRRQNAERILTWLFNSWLKWCSVHFRKIMDVNEFQLL